MNPIQLFNTWFEEERKRTKVRIPAACCLSTVGLDGYPNARFVSLKETTNDSFIVTGSLTSRKGIEISRSEQVALSFWWTETERQIRIQGNAVRITDSCADRYFAERDRDSQIVSAASEQGQEMVSPDQLTEQYNAIEQSLLSGTVTRPAHWGGYAIQPVRIEFLEFKPSRFHDRKLYEQTNEGWTVKQLQP